MKNWQYRLFLCLLGPVLLWLCWPPLPLIPLVFIGFVPLLALENHIANQGGQHPTKTRYMRLFLWGYLYFLLWNLLDTWWIKNASLWGGVMAFVLNSLFMSFPLLAYHGIKHRLGQKWWAVIFVATWMSFEFLHQKWELSFPWLNLGNSFAQFPALIQWYEVTGTSGGTLWVLIINVLVFDAWQRYQTTKAQQQYPDKKWGQKRLGLILLLLVLPVTASLIRYFTYQEHGRPVTVGEVQPNIDPWNEKFDSRTMGQQMEKFLRLSAQVLEVDSSSVNESKNLRKVDYLVWPETSIPNNDRFWLADLQTHPEILYLRNFLRKYPQTALVAGFEPFKLYDNVNESPTARVFKNTNRAYDVYNSAIQIDTSQRLQYYHKSKLVPGSERMPYPGVFKFLEPLAVQLEGISGSRGTQAHRSVFFNTDSIGVAPVICYESIYGEYVTEYIRRGANLIFIITNDGWWGKTPGYKQHAAYASLRAIETRRSIARSANTGTSCFVNQRGNILQPQPWWMAAAIKDTILANDTITIYARFGDYLSRMALFLTLCLLGWAVFLKFKR